MKNFNKYLRNNIKTGCINEIIDISDRYFKKSPGSLTPEMKADILCVAMNISRRDLDEVISAHPEVLRTVKGHIFEVVFDSMMAANDVAVIEVGGDGDIDRIVNNNSLQLKTPYIAGCSNNIVSYKTHKTHGAKSQEESIDYYHRVCDFADYLVGLVSYEPFRVLIIPKEKLPRVNNHCDYIESPMYIDINNSEAINNFKLLGIKKDMVFPTNLLSFDKNECLPLSSKLLGVKSDYILRAIFIKNNFRIWDMNIRGFIREHIFVKQLNANGIRVYPTNITGLERSDKCDVVLKNCSNRYIRFQVKGLTFNGTKFAGINTRIDCETQLSRGRVNDHPTQSRLYKDTDFEFLIIAVDPPYSNSLFINAYGKPDYNWNYYCVPMSKLKKHHKYTKRVASHQYIKFSQLQKYRINYDWLDNWKKEL